LVSEQVFFVDLDLHRKVLMMFGVNYVGEKSVNGNKMDQRERSIETSSI
jgi:hypothetical protein